MQKKKRLRRYRTDNSSGNICRVKTNQRFKETLMMKRLSIFHVVSAAERVRVRVFVQGDPGLRVFRMCLHDEG